MTFGKIMVLNGASSAGKSSLSRKLQELIDEPLFHLSIDTFEKMLGSKWLHGVAREELYQNMMQVVRGMNASARAFSQIGHHVVIDTVFEIKECVTDSVTRLADCPVLYVGVHCPPEEIARRERERGDRQIGQGVRQLGYIHQHSLYDIEVDTYAQGLEGAARQIIDALDNLDRYDAGQRMLAQFAADSHV